MRLSVVALLTVMFLATGAWAQTPFRPIATVNSSVITIYDLDQRMRLMSALGVEAPSTDVLREQALDLLIGDRLKLQAGKRAGLEVTPEIIDLGLQEYASRAGVTPDEFKSRIKRNGIDDQALEDLISPQIVWREVVRARFQSRIEPGEAEIDAEIALAAQNRNIIYRLQEIGLPFGDDGRDEAETRALADRLAVDLAAGGDFDAAVKRYSRAPSSRKGGDVGWVPGSKLPPELAAELARLSVGEIAPPQVVSGGVSILKLTDRRAQDGAAVDPNDEALRNRVRTNLMNRRLERFAEGYIQELRRDALIELR